MNKSFLDMTPVESVSAYPEATIAVILLLLLVIVFRGVRK